MVRIQNVSPTYNEKTDTQFLERSFKKIFADVRVKSYLNHYHQEILQFSGENLICLVQWGLRNLIQEWRKLIL